MHSLPTGATQAWLIVAAIGMSPMLVFFITGAINQTLGRR
jgi:hypothetical protein